MTPGKTDPKPLPSDTQPSAVVGWGIVLLGISVAVAGLAFLLQRVGFAPIGIFSLLVGTAVGAGSLLTGILFKLKPCGSFLVITILAAVTATATQHAFLYIQYRSDFQNAYANNPQVALFRDSDPEDFASYLRAEAVKFEPALGQPTWVFWLIDLTLCVVGASGTYWMFQPRASQESQTPSP